jgi:hypothetical protein
MTDFYYLNPVDDVRLESLLRMVTPTLNNIPYELALDLLRQSFTEFARRTKMLASTQSIQFQQDVLDYQLEAPEGYEIHSIRSAGYGNEIIHSVRPDYWYSCGRRRFSVISNSTLVLGTAPSTDSDDTFTIVSTVIPNERVMRIPREVSVAYGECIADGALARALVYKNKSWYDPNLAQMKKRDYYRAMGSAAALSLADRVEGNMDARMRRWV